MMLIVCIFPFTPMDLAPIGKYDLNGHPWAHWTHVPLVSFCVLATCLVSFLTIFARLVIYPQAALCISNKRVFLCCLHRNSLSFKCVCMEVYFALSTVRESKFQTFAKEFVADWHSTRQGSPQILLTAQAV